MSTVAPIVVFEAVFTTAPAALGWLEEDALLELEEDPVPELLLPQAASVTDAATAGTRHFKLVRIRGSFSAERGGINPPL
ncbi:MAG TPA: hypothetical protein VGW98_08170 [Solirubrobacteraceae bacterium]|nr:hypothetical protein [Solirubrobacteraceae bacterium]